jgi:hypothetical protein
MAIVSLTAGVAIAQQDTYCYGWEDGGTALGEYGAVNDFNDSAHVSEGDVVDALCDNLCVSIPDHAYLHFPGTGPVGVQASDWSAVKALFN